MATAPIEVTLPGVTGATLTLTLFPHGSDTAAVSSLSLTEATNRKCTYTTTTTAALTGIHLAVVKESTNTVGEGYVRMDDSTGNHVVVSNPHIAKIDGTNEQPTKGAALATFPFYMVLSSDHVSPATGKTVTAQRSIDGGAFAACTNSVTEIASGWYKIDLSAADRAGNKIALKFTASGCDPLNILNVLA